MLCENQYDQRYIEACRSTFAAHVAAYRRLSDAVAREAGATPSSTVSALKSFEAHYFNNLVLALDSHFTHWARALEKKDGCCAAP